MNTWQILEYIGVALGLSGAILVSGSTARRRRQGFSLWIASNCFLIAWAIHAAAFGLLAMYAVYSVTSIIGWRNNRIPSDKPLRDSAPALASD